MRLPATESVLRRALRGPCAMPRGTTVLVAVSGGADSTALAVALARLAPAFDLRLVIAHLHHGTRGRAADADAHHVRALAAQLGLACIAARLRPGATSETALRERRRRFLARAALRVGASAIATAHTADDQLETLLLRLGRGGSLTGLAGMRPRRGRRTLWLKPLLALTRAALEADLRAAGIGWQEDASNRDRTHARNRVRHDALPALISALAPRHSAEAARAKLAQRAAAAMAELAEADALIEQLALAALSAALTPGHQLDLARWAAQPAAIRRRMLRAWWHLATGRARPGLLAPHLAMLEQIAARGRGGARVALPAGWWASVAAGRLALHQGGGPRSGAPMQRRRSQVLA